MTVCFHLEARAFSEQSISELGMISFLSYFSFSLLSGCSRLTSWSIAWTRWKRNASWRGTSLWSWKMILKTDPKRNRFWNWNGKMRWWRLKSRSYSPSFRYKSRLLHLKIQTLQLTPPAYPDDGFSRLWQLLASRHPHTFLPYCLTYPTSPHSLSWWLLFRI